MPRQSHLREVVHDHHGKIHFVSPMRNWKETLWNRQNGRCWICGELMVRKAMRNADGSHDSKHATIDHLIPQNQGGSDDVDNLALAHHSCNCLRGRNNFQPLGSQLYATELKLFQKEQELADVLADKNEAFRLLALAGKLHATTTKQRDQAQDKYQNLLDMPKPQCQCWYCRMTCAILLWTNRFYGDTSGL